MRLHLLLFCCFSVLDMLGFGFLCSYVMDYDLLLLVGSSFGGLLCWCCFSGWVCFECFGLWVCSGWSWDFMCCWIVLLELYMAMVVSLV